MDRRHQTYNRHTIGATQQQFLVRAKWRNLVLDGFICDAYPNRYTQQKQAWKINHAYIIDHHHDTLWRQQVL